MDLISTRTIETVKVQKDINVLTCQIKRSRKGLVITAKTDPVIEELFREWAGDAPNVGHAAHGRMWEALNGPLPQLYGLSIMPDNGSKLQTVSGKIYRIDRVGTHLVDDGGINLGFLRFIGISDANGVTFVVKGVFSTDETRRVAQDLKEAVKHFYISFIKPVDVVIQMHTQEI